MALLTRTAGCIAVTTACDPYHRTSIPRRFNISQLKDVSRCRVFWFLDWPNNTPTELENEEN